MEKGGCHRVTILDDTGEGTLDESHSRTYFYFSVRFLLRSGREYDQSLTDSDKLSPRFLGYFLFRSSDRKQPLDRSTSLKEQSAHITSVKNILENHASFLMAGKELSKLVAFVKGTQFDLVLHMGTLQSRLDADFLLAHMCSVKFKEWIVVLATLLRRSESHPAFAEYQDLLEELEEKLLSVANMEEK
ncbi:hypothetical protein TanjilG_32378 [Lupinus angustifolius]|nr:hypothetical protein TanjilG_32378 [Lupinus angustifolius]